VAYGLDFISPTTGWVVGNGAMLLRTTTGGAVWTRPRVSTGPEALYDAHFPSRLTGWVVGSYGSSWRTINGGLAWRRRVLYHVAGDIGLKLLGPSLGWAVDGMVDDRPEHAAEETYAVLKSTDGGRRWAVASSGQGRALADVDFVDAARGWAVGALAVPYNDGHGNVLARNVAMVVRTSDGGATWSSPLGAADLGIDGTLTSHLLAVHFKNG
jgi:photosystem II stability/assembly factor-like uncharacterized protein